MVAVVVVVVAIVVVFAVVADVAVILAAPFAIDVEIVCFLRHRNCQCRIKW